MMQMQKSGLFAVCALIAAGFVMSGCAQRYLDRWNEPHAAEGEGFGDTVRHAMAQQIVDPDPVTPSEEEAAVDGVRTQKTVTEYKNKEVGGAAATATPGGGGGTAASVTVPAK